jgi:hypothetical protein
LRGKPPARPDQLEESLSRFLEAREQEVRALLDEAATRQQRALQQLQEHVVSVCRRLASLAPQALTQHLDARARAVSESLAAGARAASAGLQADLQASAAMHLALHPQLGHPAKRAELDQLCNEHGVLVERMSVSVATLSANAVLRDEPPMAEFRALADGFVSAARQVIALYTPDPPQQQQQQQGGGPVSPPEAQLADLVLGGAAAAAAQAARDEQAGFVANLPATLASAASERETLHAKRMMDAVAVAAIAAERQRAQVEAASQRWQSAITKIKALY